MKKYLKFKEDNMEDLKTVEAKEKATFVAILGYAARLNGLTDNEVDFINKIASDFNLTEEENKSAIKERNEIEIISILKYIVNPQTKLKLIRELFFLGYADGNLSNEEVLFVSKVANALNIPVETIEKISDWVIRGLEWEEEGQELFSA